MKKIICILTSFCLMFGIFTIPATAEAKDPFDISPSEFVEQIGAGWNLGNTFENNWATYNSVYAQETALHGAETTKEMIDLVADTGFNAVRIPVSWGPQTTKNSKGKYVVKTELLKRVQTVADWCLARNMFVVINMHHDDRKWLNISATGNAWEEVKKQYRDTWEQVATYFRNYDEKLILEGGNEILATCDFDGCKVGKTDYCWWGHSQLPFDKQNELYQIFVDTVRATGGNNDRRFLMLPTYGAQWYGNQLGKLLIPNNDKHIIVDIHWYEISNQMNIEGKVKPFAKDWIKYSQAKGFGVVFGECGFYDNVEYSTKVNWANTFVNTVRGTYKIPVFLWDDGGDMRIMNRRAVAWTTNGAPYVEAVIENSRKYIARPDGKPVITWVLGDANNNEKFDSIDVVYLRKQLIKSLKTEFNPGADANADGKVDVADLLKMRRVLARLETFDYN
ncbi:MAG: cellulase family glycosylhydrolase [Clostridia bacterium]|nr:cellulase family glycosylhydrolase [Clostridia bacterium]